MDIFDRIKLTWPDVSVKDVMQVGPLGTRPADNVLLYNRRNGRVCTGTNQGRSCFEGSVEEFERKVNEDYSQRVASHPHERQRYERLWREYKLTIGFIRSLPPLEDA